MNLQIGDYLSLRLCIDSSRFALTPEALFGIAVRKNNNRPFLFVSKVLGKHLPMPPVHLLCAGKLLSQAFTGCLERSCFADSLNAKEEGRFPEIWEQLKNSREDIPPSETTLMIGFAETATGLAQAVANCFQGNIAYIHSTRLFLPEEESVSFEEAHSHAKGHHLYLKRKQAFLDRCKRVVLIDDELTTARTALRLIRKLHSCYGIHEFVILTLLDWSDESDQRALERELSVRIQVLSLLRGKIEEVKTNPPEEMEIPSVQNSSCNKAVNLINTEEKMHFLCRTLTFSEELDQQNAACEAIAAKISANPQDTLFLGTGELIYAPALIAGLAGGKYFHSTTQSPIYPLSSSAIVSGVHFDPPDIYSEAGYLYNVSSQKYNRAILFTEQSTRNDSGLSQLCSYLEKQGMAETEVIAL